jgi:armadillo repeat-containing protein 6
MVAMSTHPDDSKIQEFGCHSLASIALRSPDNAAALMEKRADEMIVHAMRGHPTASAVQRGGCMAIRNFVCRAHEHRPVREEYEYWCGVVWVCIG